MAKFKVGDKVFFSKKLVENEQYDRFTYFSCIMPKGIEFEVIDVNSNSTGVWYGVRSKSNDRVAVSGEMIELVEQPSREFIVIHRSGNVITAEHRLNREIIKSAKATCAPSATFDFDTGAKLAFDRLMGREEPKPAPAPEPPKYYTGKVRCVGVKGSAATEGKNDDTKLFYDRVGSEYSQTSRNECG